MFMSKFFMKPIPFQKGKIAVMNAVLSDVQLFYVNVFIWVSLVESAEKGNFIKSIFVIEKFREEALNFS